MAETTFTVRAYQGASRRHTVRVEGPARNFRLETNRIEAGAVVEMDDVCRDLLEIACAVFAGDSSVPRGGDTRAGFGQAWRRDFGFSVAVARPDVWNRPDVRQALTEAVSFLTDDSVRFAFQQAARAPRAQPFFDFGEGAAPFRADEVILFSGGLDSFAGALEALSGTADNVLLVTHRSAQKAIPRQKVLGSYLAQRFEGRVRHLQIRATRIGSTASESTQRSRSFMFTALGYVVARMFEATRLSFYENGVISHNLPINAGVVGTMATRTTHPLALRRLGRVLALVRGATGSPRVSLGNPYAWLTKKEVLERIVRHEGQGQISRTVSCTVIRKQSRRLTHCGACSQCLDRRFAIVAAGLEAHDPGDAYRTDVFLGPRPEDQSRTMALDWTGHAWDLAEMDAIGFWSRFTGEYARIAHGHPELAPQDVIRMSHELHRRHGASVREALARMLGTNAVRVLSGPLENSSLLHMFTRSQLNGERTVELPAPPVIAPAVPRPSDGRARHHGPQLLPLEVRFRTEASGPVVDVVCLDTLTGRCAELVHALKVPFDEDRTAKLARDQCRYMQPREIGLKETSKEAVKMLVQRTRTTLARAYEQIEGSKPPEFLLIQNRRPAGYRLDPDIRVVGAVSGQPASRRKRIKPR